jgi:glycosyltransferase involved in cell wall biosynthesis
VVGPVPSLWVVIPALNEETTLSQVVLGLKGLGAEVLVVDDHSSDRTADIASSAGATVIRSLQNQGYDASISTGLNAAFEAGALVAVTCDADGQHQSGDIIRMAEPLLAGRVALCVGIRDHYNRSIERILGIPSKWIFGTPDPFCGLKGYTRSFWHDCGPFPSDLMVGTLPLVWAARRKIDIEFISIQISPRADRPRFGRTLLASWKLTIAFSRALWAYANSSRRARAPSSSNRING